MKPRSFFAELKRRDVYKVAVAYVVVSWVILQAASILLPTFDAPACVMKVVLVAIALGFILSVIISWAFEITPEGIKRTEDIAVVEASEMVRQLEARARQEFVRGYLFALVQAGLGDKTKAIDYLDLDSIDTSAIRGDPMLDLLRGDPRVAMLADNAPEATQYSASLLTPNSTHFGFQATGPEAKADFQSASGNKIVAISA